MVRLWETSSKTPAWSIRDHAATVLAVAFAPDGKSLATADADGLIKLRDVKTGSDTRTLSDPLEAAASVTFSSAGLTLVVGAADGVASLWDVGSGCFGRSGLGSGRSWAANGSSRPPP